MLGAEKAPDFTRDIRPILSRNCFACHGPDEHDRRGGLRLDDRQAASAELDSGAPAIVPGRPDESELIARVYETDPDTVMPPPESNHVLSSSQKETLAKWIAAGAPYSPHWAYVPPRDHPAPAIEQGDWPHTWIDRFVLGRIESEGLAPAADADPLTLVRRVTFDLTGLPPTPAEVDAFLSDTGPDGYMLLVDRLLVSPRHAERLAAWWLDLVRYADTVGYHGDQDHSISPYRDWVIKAFLDNVPFDRFTVLQLAGDVVCPEGREHADDPVLASGYNRLLQTTHEGGLQLKEYRAIYQADRIRNLSGVWMGATVGCAQCHDHKYDPYTSRDFYALGAFFADIDDEKHLEKGGFGGQNLNTLPTRRDPEVPIVGPFDRDRADELDARIHSIDTQLPPLVLPPRAQPPEPEAENVVASRIELDALRSERARLTRPLMVTRPLKPPRDVRILPRGNWMDESGPLVEPAVPAFLGRIGATGRPRRADLAGRTGRCRRRGRTHGPRHGKPNLVALFRRRALPQHRRPRRPGRTARPPRTARPAGARIHPARLGPAHADPHDRDQSGLPDDIVRVGRPARPRSRQSTARPARPLAVAGRGRARHRALCQRASV